MGYKNLKDYIIEYQNGNADVLDELIGIREVEELNSRKTRDKVNRLRFNDRALDATYWQLNVNYSSVDGKQMDHIINKAFFDINDDGQVKSILDNVNTSMPDLQVVAYVKQRLNGFIKDYLKKERKDYDDHITRDTIVLDWIDDDEDNVMTKTDFESYRQFKEVDDKVDAYSDFKQYLGGSVENILSGMQLKVYREMQDTEKTQQDIADKLGCKQQQVSDTLKRISNKINKKYIEWKTLKSLQGTENTYNKITNFLESYHKFIKFDVADQFDYFGLILEFLKENYSEDDQMADIEGMQANGVDNHNLSVMDVVVDYCKPNTYDILIEQIVNENDDVTYTNRVKKSFYFDIIKCFSKYIKSVKVSVAGFSDQLMNCDDPIKIKDSIGAIKQ